MHAADLMSLAVKLGASDIHFTAGKPSVFRINGVLYSLDDPGLRERLGMEEDFKHPLIPEETSKIAQEITALAQYACFEEEGELDFSFGIAGVARVRANLFKQRGSTALALRILSSSSFLGPTGGGGCWPWR